MQNESSEVTEERLAKLMEEKMQNNGTRNEAGKCNLKKFQRKLFALVLECSKLSLPQKFLFTGF